MRLDAVFLAASVAALGLFLARNMLGQQGGQGRQEEMRDIGQVLTYMSRVEMAL